MLNSAILEKSDDAPDLHQTAATQFIDVKGTWYAYRVLANQEGIPLIFLQHFTGTMDNWDPAVTNGFAKYFKVILFDNKGIAASGGETPDTINAMAQDAIAFINALGFKKVNLLGFSMGGFIAQQITLTEPGLVNKIILAGTGPKAAEGLRDITKPLNASASMNPDDQKLFLFYSSTPTSRSLGRESLARISKRIVHRDPEIGMDAAQSQLKSMLDWGQPDSSVLDMLKQITQPVFIVNGNNDIMIPTVNSYILFNNLPNAKLSVYPDAGHGSIFQYPVLFLSEAIPFLNAQ